MNNTVFNGRKVIVQQTVITEKIINISWKNRIFSWPFKPWVKLKTITEALEIIPDGEIIYTDDALVVNVRTFEKLKLIL